jgi:hypothetical protein
MPKPILQGCTIALVGNLGKARDPASLKRWVDANGGNFTNTRIEAEVTHLICSGEAFKSNNAAIRKAEQLKIPIVTYDWLEDSLLKKNRYQAKGKYLAKNAFKLSAKEKAERRKRERKALKKDGMIFPGP